MKLNLTRSDKDLVDLFLVLETKYHIATLLEVPYSVLIYLLYRVDKPTPYKKFILKKKSGGTREIVAPISSLKILQRKLTYILYLFYKPRFSVYGFCKNKNIVGNAHMHTEKKLVLNVDLQDFFPTIHIGRIIGLFKARPFNLPNDVAVMLAQICCFEGKLPQGAPTSPVLANMICAGLDTELQALAKANHCVYTRYADDITFSTTAKTLGEDIASMSERGALCGAKLTGIIEKHGFKINPSKVRLQTPRGRQEVTGLTVNEFPNISRKYIRQVRAMIYVLKRFGNKDAGKVYFEKYSTKLYNPARKRPDFSTRLLGKIAFIKAVRGGKDPIYRKLINKYNKALDPKAIELPVGVLNELKASLWVVKTAAGYTGTAFFLDKVGIITCEHVVSGATTVKLRNWVSGEEVDAVVKKKHSTADLAVLEITTPSGKHFPSLPRSKTGTAKEGDLITVAGFPGYDLGDPPQCWDAKVSAKSGDPTNGTGIYVERFTIDKHLFGGMSGSPVVDQDNKVVGVAVHGSKTIKEVRKIWDYGFTPIYHLDNIA